MDKEHLIKRIKENEDDMIKSLKEFQGEQLIPLFEEYTKDVIWAIETEPD